MKTPGVYIVDANAFPNSVVEVPTAVPAFVGHTEVARNHGVSLAGKPWRVTSLTEYQQLFGFGPKPRFDIVPKAVGPLDIAFQAGGQDYWLSRPGGKAGGNYLLYYSILHFFQNGGGACYIVSAGDYQAELSGGALKDGIDALETEQEPTLLAVPEAVLLGAADCGDVQQAMLRHCGGVTRNRMAILDIREGWRSENDSECITNFRAAVGPDFLGFGAAYYPWVNTTVLQDSDLSYDNFSPGPGRDLLTGLFGNDPAQLPPLPGAIFSALKVRLNLLPPSGALAGIYAMVDGTRGVWKAPANVGLEGVVSPAVSLSSAEQQDLNVPLDGKAVNAIRAFPGQGTLVWGARTLDGNSLDWRYISVRRTMIMLEESCRLAVKAMAFEANVAGTWTAIKAMIGNFLTGVWQRGGLAGAQPDEAFSVRVGLGETMTAADVLAGVLRVTVLVAIVRPAEFLEFTLEQQQAP